jgi:membrane protein YqaA with SNARE-associated domain
MNKSNLLQKYTLLTFLFLGILFIGVAILGIFFKESLALNSELVITKIGFSGLFFLTFLSDFFISFTPPDTFLMIIANSSLSESGLYYAIGLSIASTLAGSAGWLLGFKIISQTWAPEFLKRFALKQAPLVAKFGWLVVCLGAISPLPYSATNWAAGMSGVSYKVCFWASLLRIPRIIGAYLIIIKALKI